MTEQTDRKKEEIKMNTNEKTALFQQIVADLDSNEDFFKAFIATEDETALQEILNEKGYEVSLDDVREMFEDGRNEILKYKENADDELSEQDLETVAGGGLGRYLVRGMLSCAVAFGFGCLCGVCPAAAVATPYVAGGLALWCAAGAMKKGW